MTKPLFFDSYIKEFEANIVLVIENSVELDESAFYPEGGGQPTDKGKLIRLNDNKEFSVSEVKKREGKVIHKISELGLQQGDKVKGIIDWERRYKFMRMHTAAHLLSAVINKLTGALVTGKQLKLEESRVDFALEVFDREKIQHFADETNKIIEKGGEVKTYILPREEAMKIPNIVRLAERMPPNIPELRIVEIADSDIQACAGTHVKELKEIGKIKVLKAENKGKDNRRMYFTLE